MPKPATAFVEIFEAAEFNKPSAMLENNCIKKVGPPTAKISFNKSGISTFFISFKDISFLTKK